MRLQALCLFLISASIIHVEAQTTTPPTVSLLSGAIRLARDGVSSSSYSSGRVQVYGIGAANSISNRWGNICRFTSFGTSEADVICHQLTYTGASSHSYAEIDSFGNDNYTALLNDVSCSNDNYLMLFQCTVSTTVSTLCTAREDVSVTCYSTRIWDDPYNGMVRLSQGDYVNTGLLEVYCKGEWGTVCDNTFGAEEGTAV
ncbi:PREDICTED: neurotrypsin-like, partial [Amphimedon queenslandica]|uniref:SRCR domain-containing protein n=2 Tax=Amphimedon queenslandica TaxID=400682 RepID=A0AAN0K225_AMPQE